MTAIFFHNARHTLIVRNASDSETFAATRARKSCMVSGSMVRGSVSAKTGAIHFHALGQSSRLACSDVHLTPRAFRSAARIAETRE